MINTGELFTTQIELSKFDRRDYKIFSLFIENPTISASAIAKKLNLGTQSVIDRYNKFKDQGIFRPDKTIDVPGLGTRLQTEVEADYKPEALGLIRKHVMFENIQGKNELHTLKAICSLHPYIHYHVDCFKDGVALFAQFDIPTDASSYFNKFLELLDINRLYSDRIDLDNYTTLKSNPRISNWDYQDQSWDLSSLYSSSYNLLNKMEILWEEFLKSKTEFKLNLTYSDKVQNFDSLDYSLIRELTVNSKVILSDLAKVYGKTVSTISRRVKKLRKQVLPSDLLYYNHTYFGLSYPQLITGKFDKNDEVDMSQLNSFIKSPYFPFVSSAIVNYNQFIWFILSPPSIASDISQFIWSHCKDVRFYQIQPNSAFTYYFVSDNDNDGQWKQSKDYIVNSAFEKFKEMMVEN